MDEVKQIIAQAIDNAGGSLGWDDAMAQVPFDKRRWFVAAIKSLEQEGTYKRQVTATENGATFALVKIASQ